MKYRSTQHYEKWKLNCCGKKGCAPQNPHHQCPHLAISTMHVHTANPAHHAPTVCDLSAKYKTSYTIVPINGSNVDRAHPRRARTLCHVISQRDYATTMRPATLTHVCRLDDDVYLRAYHQCLCAYYCRSAPVVNAIWAADCTI